MIIATTGGIGYYFFNYFTHPVYEIIVNKNTIFQTNNDDCFDDYNNKIKQLNEEITIKNEELKEPSLSPQEKKVIEEIVKLKTQQKKNYKLIYS
ncbi:hypothetical protein [New Jersey aster yellows phytoplasma]|uniref:hypothetical protein n=1 Tax=New Jersey aster yellows phytoplasma TaxID=270520 RepID=UPI002093E48F|nr:hypothetical protein [New Jersey aster yellows phytoplasma]